MTAFARGVAFATSIAAATAGASAAVRPTAPQPFAASASVGRDVVGKLAHIVTIGSTVDPMNGDQNPYGLAISPATAGALTAGDLVICNFNDSANIQGLGTTIEVLHPAPGSTPVRLAQAPQLTGCDALVVGPTGNPWVAAYDANDNPVLSASGQLFTSLNNFGWTGPWGQTFSATKGPFGAGAFYESNANDGSIVRINLTSKGFTFDKIVTGFSVNHGVPGQILAPSGLSYDAARDVLYVVDSNENRIVALNAPGRIPAGGVIVRKFGFFGPAGAAARIVYAGAPLNAPISSALLFNGNLVVGNTANNRLIEISPALDRVVAAKLLDSGAPGALFGIAASGTSAATTNIYFNDDNDNTVKVLQM